MRRDYLILAGFAAAVAVIPLFVHNAYYLEVMTKIGVFTILTLGVNLVMGYAGQVSLGHAAFFGVGAYVSMILTSPDPMLPNWLASFSFVPGPLVSLAGALTAFTSRHMVLAALIAAAVTAGVALIVGVPTLRLKGQYLAMATLGFGIIMEIVFKEELELTGGISGTRVPKFSAFGATVSLGASSFHFVWITAAVLLLFAINLVHSRQGRALRAIHADETAAATSGVPVHRMKVAVFVMSAVYASIAGTLYAHLQTHVSPTPFGFMESVKIVVMVVVGGMGSIWGAPLGAGLLYSLPQIMTSLEDFEMAIFGLILIVVMMISPKGLTGIAGLIAQKAAGLLRKEKP
jgi:branched-chain amino acid transport system permease protein